LINRGKNYINFFVIISIVVSVTLSAVSSHGYVWKHKCEHDIDIVLKETAKENVIFDFNEDRNIVLTFSFDKPVITNVIKGEEVFNQVAIEGLPMIGDIGVPLLPVKPINLLLPQKAAVESIDVVNCDVIQIGDGYNVEIGATPVILTALNNDKSNKNIRFNPMISYPVVNFENIGIHDFRGYSILTFNLYPVQYLGINGRLSYFSEITVTITISNNDMVNSLFRRFPTDEIVMREMIDDFSMDISSTYVAVDPEVFPKSMAASGDSYDYVVVTSEELKNSSGEYTFQDLIQYKINNGISATIVTIENINATYSGVDLPEKIRNCE